MKKSIFEYIDYKQYLENWMLAKPGKGRGERSKLAKALKCHSAYISHVLNGMAHLNLEQAEAANKHLKHDAEESHYFILLTLYERAGTGTLKDYFMNQIRVVQERRLTLRNRRDFKQSLSREDQATYYSAWYYSVIDLLAGSSAEFQSPESIAQYLSLPIEMVKGVIEFLLSRGILLTENGQYRLGETKIHLGNDSPMITKHHTNWRLQALHALEQGSSKDFHYSSVVMISRRDLQKIKATLIQAIEEVRSAVKESGEEALFCYALDLFEVGGRN